MTKELVNAVGESLIRLRFLVGRQFVKPIKELERERSELSPGHIHLMRWMHSKGNVPISMTDLAAAACISKPNLTTMVDRLSSDGFVVRSADPNDRRIVNVALTEEGVAFLHRHKVEMMKFVEKKLSLLEDKELMILKESLDNIMDVVNIMEERQKQEK